MKYIRLVFFLILINAVAYGQKTVSDTAKLDLDYIKTDIELLQNELTILKDSIININNRIVNIGKEDNSKLKKFTSNWIPLLSLLIALITIFFGWKAIEYNRKVKRYELVLNITTEYASEEMLSGILKLRNWEKENSEKEKSFSDEFGKLRKKKYDKIKDIDVSRRKISHFFHRIYLLYENKVIDKREIMNIITVGQIDLLHELIEPLEEAINKDYNRKMFLFFDEIKRELKKLK